MPTVLEDSSRATKVNPLVDLRSVPRGRGSGVRSDRQMSRRPAKASRTEAIAGDQYSTYRPKFRFMLSLMLVIVSSLSPSATQGQAVRSMTVRDSIEKVTFISDAYNGSELANFSAD